MYENKDNINNALLIFTRKNHPYLKSVIDSFIRDYDGNDWAKNGPVLIKKSILNFCNINNYLELELFGFKPAAFSNNPLHQCSDLILFPESYFYPFAYVRGEHEKIFKPNSSLDFDLLAQVKDSYSFHFYNKISSSFQAKPNDGSFFTKIAAANCEHTFNYVKQNNLVFYS